MTRAVDLMIHNDLSEIAIVRDALDRLGSELAVPVRALMQLQVALDEIVSNVVKYSWPDGSKHEFLVRITVNATGARTKRAARRATPAARWCRNPHDQEARGRCNL
jgi:anti-sigma regulatory factor (Ser/Thr protein kinase)